MSSGITQISIRYYSRNETMVRRVMENWPIVGRRVEVASILTRLRRGVGTVIAGEAGVGKTTLVREVQRQLDLGGWRTQLVRCTSRSGLPLPTFMPVEIESPRSTAGGRRAL